MIEYLDAAIAAIGHVDVALGVGGDAVRRIELARPVPGLPHCFTQSPFLSYLATRELM